jgi:hypothetical protein
VDQTANSVEEWLRVAARHRAAAEQLVTLPELTQLSWSNAGFACECVFKAAIMAKERLNSWPSRSSRPELYTHDLAQLAKILGFEVKPIDQVAPAWSVVVRWRRHHMYNSNNMPMPVAQGLMDAVFGEEGVTQCLKQSYLKTYI